MYVYIRSEPTLWTVGFFRPDGEWEPESDQGSPKEAAERVAWLNGSRPDVDPREVPGADPTARDGMEAATAENYAAVEGGTFDVVAELQRQLDITIAARRRAEERGETVPDSGMPGFEGWHRRTLAEAGET